MCRFTPPAVVAFFALSCVAVKPLPIEPVEPRATCEEDAAKHKTACTCMCDNLQMLLCPEADNMVECVGVCTKAMSSGKFDLKTTCVSKANTVAEVRKCGTVRCKDRS